MFCGNCGSEIQEGLEICSKCGKSPNGVGVEDKNTKMSDYPLINLSSKLFYPMFEVCLWVNLIVCTVGGGIASYYLTGGNGGYYRNSGNPLPGILIGLVVGFLSMIISGGLISIFLKINENIEKMTRN